MEYRVKITTSADSDLESIYVWMKKNYSVEAASSWYAGIIDAIKSLSSFPARCPVILERRKFDTEIRHHLYGNRRHAHRIIFRIGDDNEGPFVSVLRIRHSSQRSLRPDELNLN